MEAEKEIEEIAEEVARLKLRVLGLRERVYVNGEFIHWAYVSLARAEMELKTWLRRWKELKGEG